MEVGETVEFIHKPTGLLVSTIGILNRQDDGWLEVNDNVNDKKTTKAMTMTMIMTMWLKRMKSYKDEIILLALLFNSSILPGGDRRQHFESDVL